MLSTIKPGDYLFIQFGHNDQKERGEGVGAFTTYKQSLKHFVAEARERGAIPVLVTPMNRRTFDADGKVTNSLGDYPEAVRQVAREENVPLIDLNAMSKPFYEALGPGGLEEGVRRQHPPQQLRQLRAGPVRRRGDQGEPARPRPVPRRRPAAVRPGPPRPDRPRQHPGQPATAPAPRPRGTDA